MPVCWIEPNQWSFNQLNKLIQLSENIHITLKQSHCIQIARRLAGVNYETAPTLSPLKSNHTAKCFWSEDVLTRPCFPLFVLACELKDCTSQLFWTLNGSILQMTECWIQNSFADGRLGLLLWWGEQLQREHSLSMLAKNTGAVSKQRVSGKLWDK